jgi:hypothetical protein
MARPMILQRSEWCGGIGTAPNLPTTRLPWSATLVVLFAPLEGLSQMNGEPTSVCRTGLVRTALPSRCLGSAIPVRSDPLKNSATRGSPGRSALSVPVWLTGARSRHPHLMDACEFRHQGDPRFTVQNQPFHAAACPVRADLPCVLMVRRAPEKRRLRPSDGRACFRGDENPALHYC